MRKQTKILHPYNPKKSKLGELNAPVLHTSTVSTFTMAINDYSPVDGGKTHRRWFCKKSSGHLINKDGKVICLIKRQN